ncbi:hypothetical protein Q9R34_19355 [Enterobacter sp. BRE11]|nr:hypothetical protein [Enterobacter sp. BRE11]
MNQATNGRKAAARIVAKNTDPGNTFPVGSSNNDLKSVRITGFDLERIIELSPLPKRMTRILKFACNLAGSTSKFVIMKSLSNLAEEAGCSVSTVQRAYRLAEHLGILTREIQYDKFNRNKCAPSKYTFTGKALAFVRASIADLQAANLKVSGRQKNVRSVIAKAFIKFNFIHNTPSQKDCLPPGQNDREEVITDPRKRETLNGQPEISGLNESTAQPPAPAREKHFIQDSQNDLAAAAAAADKERRAETFERNGSLLHRLFNTGRLKSRFNSANGRKQNGRRTGALPGDGISHDYAIPEGFRGA